MRVYAVDIYMQVQWRKKRESLMIGKA